VAAFAAVPVRGACKLPAVAVVVTLIATRKARMVVDTGARSGMAWPAGDCRMLAPQRKLRRSVLGGAEEGRLPSVLGVARRALPAIAVRKLALVAVPVAIDAPLVRQRRAEVFRLVALPACHLSVSPGQREFCFAVVEPARDARPFPA